jgi:ABC-2 type transport system ATP-binding protein
MSEITLENVVKRYGSHVAVRDLSLRIPGGRIFGLLGPNGAGKTSTIRMMMNIYQPDSGQIRFDGRILGDEARRRLGYLPEERGLYKRMRVAEHLEYLGRLKGLSRGVARTRTRDYLERLDLASRARSRVEELSKGMQQKVQFAAALLHEPSVIILDEPFSGLDPVNIQLLIDWMKELKDKGVTIVFSTHQMDTVERLCESIALIYRGELILEGALAEIKARGSEDLYRLQFEPGDSFIPAAKGIVAAMRRDGAWIIQIQPDKDGDWLIRRAQQSGRIRRFERIEPSLHDLFIEAVRRAGYEGEVDA